MKPPEHKRVEPASVFAKKSTLPGVGKGLFARRLILKGERIIEYKGRITTFREVQESEVVNPYIYYVNRNHVIDAMPFPESLGRYANDAQGPVQLAGCVNNAKFLVVAKRVFFEATANIQPGAEIFVSYGKGYWETIAINESIQKSYGAPPNPKAKQRR